jgi:hypothetical protein
MRKTDDDDMRMIWRDHAAGKITDAAAQAAAEASLSSNSSSISDAASRCLSSAMIFSGFRLSCVVMFAFSRARRADGRA